jgi:hypothetical protein
MTAPTTKDDAMPETRTAPLPNGWHARRLKEAAKASRELMRWSLFLNGRRTITQRIREFFA